MAFCVPQAEEEMEEAATYQPTTMLRIIRCMRLCTLVDLLSFYTTINILLVIAWPLTSKVLDPFLSAFVVTVVSSYIVYIRPRTIVYRFPSWCPGQHAACGGALYGLDLQANHVLVHVAPLVIAGLLVHRFGDAQVCYMRVCATVVLMLVYNACVSPKHVYGLACEELALVTMVAIAVYCCLRR